MAAPHLSRPFQTHTGVCKSGRGCIAKKNWRQPRPVTRHPRMQRKRRVAADDLAFSLLSLCPPKTYRCKSGQAPGASREFFFCQTVCIVCRSTYYYCRTIISPLFCNRRKWPFRLIIFCADHLHGWRPYWSLSIPFLQLSKITNRT